jgi:phosphate transport system protein
MTPHIVGSFDAELEKLTALVVDMGALVRHQVDAATECLRSRDQKAAAKIIASDDHIDEIQLRLEDMVIQMIAKRQPVAVDLRETISTLKISTDLERIGDLAKNNAKRVVAMNNQQVPAGIGATLDALSVLAVEQLERALQAYARRDQALARSVWENDNRVDMAHTALFRELLTYMMEDPRSIGYCAHLLFCAKNLERVGDHATNIAENVFYIATGTFLAGERPKGDSIPHGQAAPTAAGKQKDQ